MTEEMNNEENGLGPGEFTIQKSEENETYTGVPIWPVQWQRETPGLKCRNRLTLS